MQLLSLQLQALLLRRFCLHVVFLYSAEFRFGTESPERGVKSHGVEGEPLGYYGLLRDRF